MNSAFRNVLPLLVVGAGLVGLSSCADPYGYGGSSYSSYNYSSYPYGYTRNALPYGYNSTYIGGTQYWHCNDHYYRHYPGRGYVVVQRPAGRSAHYDRDHRNDDHKDYTDRRDDRGGRDQSRDSDHRDDRRPTYVQPTAPRSPSGYDPRRTGGGPTVAQPRIVPRTPVVSRPPEVSRTPEVRKDADKRDKDDSSDRNKSDHRSIAPGADRSRKRN
jgi:hypothetical protein